MNGNITALLNGVIANGGAQNRFTSTSANLAVNGFLADIQFTMPSGYTGKWDFLKDIFVTITKRIGSGNGGAVALLSNVSLYDMLSYSDFKHGVSMHGTDFTAGNVCRISGYLKTGYFSMSSRDALEVTLNVASRTNFPAADVTFELSSVFKAVEITNYICYQSAKPTGADQPYKNVLEVAYIGSGTNADFVVNDQIGNKNVNINSAIANSNAQGNFEFFTGLGIVYEEQFGISQDLSMRCPTTGSPSLFIVSMAFYPEETVDSVKEMVATKQSLIANIKNSDPDKYKYLLALGLTS
jgi:hypothetical protein